MTPIRRLFVSKESGSSADTFLAVGLAILLSHLYQSLGRSVDIILRDQGPSIMVELSPPLSVSNLEHVLPLTILEPLVIPAQQEKRGAFTGFHLLDQQAIASSFFEKVQTLPAQMRHPLKLREWQQTTADIPLPHPRLVFYQMILAMNAANTFNEIILAWSCLTPEEQRQALLLLLDFFSEPLRDLTVFQEARASWKQFGKKYRMPGNIVEVTALQLINPSQGKGANHPKANKLSIGAMKNLWLIEYLKFLGYFHACLPYFVKDPSEDVKIYTLQPTEMTLSQLSWFHNEMVSLCWSASPVKLDIQVVLLCSQQLLIQRKLAHQAETLVPHMHFISATHYKKMQAYVVLNNSFAGIPSWVNDSDSVGDDETRSRIVERQLSLIHSLPEGQFERPMLQHYRRFLSTGDQSALLAFTDAYGPFVLRERDRHPERYLRQMIRSDLEFFLASHS